MRRDRYGRPGRINGPAGVWAGMTGAGLAGAGTAGAGLAGGAAPAATGIDGEVGGSGRVSTVATGAGGAAPAGGAGAAAGPSGACSSPVGSPLLTRGTLADEPRNRAGHGD